MRESRRRIEDTTEPKKDRKQILCFRTKTAHIEQLLFDPIGPFPKYCHITSVEIFTIIKSKIPSDNEFVALKTMEMKVTKCKPSALIIFFLQTTATYTQHLR